VTSARQPAAAGAEVPQARILIVVPTLGQRIGYLRRTLASIRDQNVPVDILVITPGAALEARALAHEVGAGVLDDPGGLSAAINLGVEHAQARHEYVNWLGDDDTLTRGSLAAVMAGLDSNRKASAAFGQCLYVDEMDNPLWVSQAGRFAPWILPWGPNMVPQPGLLVRREAWKSVRGLDETLSYTMDLDLLLKLRRWGPLIAVPRIVSTFRWHVESLTVAERSASLAESEMVKRRYLPKALIPVAPAWEAPVRWATRRAATAVSERAGTNGDRPGPQIR
jgi:glycosyltransferase involved in cell wall biosynthesis